MDTELPSSPSRPGTRARYNRGERAPTDAGRVSAFQLEASTGEVDGPAWLAIRDDVWAYGMRVLPTMIREGRVWPIYRRLGGRAARDLALPIRGVTHEAAHDLASDVVVASLQVFANQLLQARWTPAGGASLRTWFIGLTILRLPSVWRPWLTAEYKRPAIAAIEPNSLVDLDSRPDAVIYKVEFERHVSFLNEELASIVRLDADGLTDEQIADATRRTAKSVEYQLAKARRAGRARRARELLRDRRTGAA